MWYVKQDLRRKARIVAGRHLVEILDHNTYYFTVKDISLKPLHFIANRKGLDQFCGNISNTYVNAYTHEKVYAVSGKYFGYLQGILVFIIKGLYGIFSFSKMWHAYFAEPYEGLNLNQQYFTMMYESICQMKIPVTRIYLHIWMTLLM